jgi:hypothetical protein
VVIFVEAQAGKELACLGFDKLRPSLASYTSTPLENLLWAAFIKPKLKHLTLS